MPVIVADNRAIGFIVPEGHPSPLQRTPASAEGAMSTPPPLLSLVDSLEPHPGRLRFKICLIGDPGVGKTSLVARFARNEFSDGYIHTIGTKVSKKELEIADPKTGQTILMSLLIWDIMGQPAFRELLRDAYFHGASGVLGAHLSDKQVPCPGRTANEPAE